MAALKEVFAEFGVDVDTSKLDKANAAVEVGIGLLGKFGAALGASALVAGARAFAEDFAASAREVRQGAEGLGVTAREFQALRFATQSAGVGAEQLNAALGAFLQKAIAAKAGGAEAAAAFRAVSTHVTDAHGELKPALELFQEVAAGLGEVENPTRRAGLAMQLFGEQGRKLLPILTESAGGVTDLMEQFQALGGGLSDDGITAAGRYQAAMLRWNTVTDGVRSRLAVVLLPVVERVVTGTGRLVARLESLTRGTHAVQIALGGLAAAAVAATAPLWAAAAPAVALGAAFALAALAVDDLVTFLQGGDSALGRFLDKMGGVGTSKDVVIALKLAWADFNTVIAQTGPILREVNQYIRDSARDAFEWSKKNDWIIRLLARGVQAARPAAAAAWNAAGQAGQWLDAHNLVLNERGFAAAGQALGLGGGDATMEASVALHTEHGRRGIAPTVQHTTTNHITIQGVSDPREAARAAAQELDRRERARVEAAHPLLPRGT